MLSFHEWLQMRWLTYRKLSHFQQLRHTTLALCLDDPLETVAVTLYIKAEGGSLLLLPERTPPVTASTLAQEAGCTGLLIGNAETYFKIDHLRGNEAQELSTTTPTIEGNNPPSLYQYSSGTSGRAKLIRRSWHEIDREIAAYNRRLSLDEGVQTLVAASTSHSYGLICGVMAALARKGAAPIVTSGSSPKQLLRLMKEHPNHLIYAVPVIYQLLLDLTRDQVKYKRIMTSGAPLSPTLYDRLVRSTDTLMQQYGCSELGCISVSTAMRAVEDIGQPLDHVQVIVGEGAEAASEIIVRLGSHEVGTGDLGYRDASKRLHLLSRIDDVINIGGKKVYPYEVERVLLNHREVKEAVVYRTPHPVAGDRVTAMLVAEASLTQEMIRRWCSEYLPPYQLPTEIHFVQTLPRNAAGKISRKALSAETFNVKEEHHA